jgi:hypothetical protein
VFLIILVVILGLLLKPPDRLSTKQQPATVLVKNASSFQSKLGELQEAHQEGQQGAEARLTSEEVGAALIAANQETPAPQSTATPVANGATNNSAVTPEQVPVKDPQVIFEGDEVKGQFLAQVYGKDMFVTLSGHLGAKDGYVTFNPTSFKIGSMPVPVSLVQAQLDKKFGEPETREKLKLPDFVSDLRIENGQLVIVEK